MEKDKIIHNFNEVADTKKTEKNKFAKKPIILFAVLVLLGIGTGYIVAQTSGPSLIPIGGGQKTTVSLPGVDSGKTFGSTDEKTFKDNAEGMLREGGVDGEGAFHLERPGGESQNVYLTSSVIDLSQFVGKKVKVWGETHSAEKAGWLMDVGRLQIL
jgi:hypothetical protein